MSFRIQNNIAALNSLRHLNRNETQMNRSLERLSSGFRINSAADDAAGLASSMRFRAEVSSLRVASRNASEATSLLQVAEGAMGEIDLILNRMKELATQAASGNAGSDRTAIDAESQALVGEIDRIVGFTKYNGTKLLDGNFGSVALSSTAPVDFTAANGVEHIDVSNAAAASSFTVSAVSASANTITLSDGTVSQQVTYSAALGQNENQVLNFSQLGIKLTVNMQFAAQEAQFDTDSKIHTGALGQALFQIGNENATESRLGFNLSAVSASSLGVGSVSLLTTSSAQSALTSIDSAISTLAGNRGDAGALINRLSYASSTIAVSIENKTASESIIRDVDMAMEMSQFTKNQILVQASTSMLAQANVAPQAVLSLLR
ncbi:MAG: flagellin [Myxococcales bacterium]|nr:MAG: flagellin [Myxococcales bacterium]